MTNKAGSWQKPIWCSATWCHRWKAADEKHLNLMKILQQDNWVSCKDAAGKDGMFEPQFTLAKSEGYRDHGPEKGSWHLSFIHQHMLKFSSFCGFFCPPLSWSVSFTEFKFKHLVELTARLLFFKGWKVKEVTQLWSALLALDHILACNLWTQGPANEENSWQISTGRMWFSIYLQLFSNIHADLNHVKCVAQWIWQHGKL